MKITIDRNCNIIIDGARSGYVAVGAHSIAGETSIYRGAGHHEAGKGRQATHITEAAGPALWSGHVSDLTVDVFVRATGYRQQDTIVIKAPAGTKTRWVRQSQREGSKLSDWIIQHVEASMSHQIQAHIVIPADVTFADLKMLRDSATGDIAFDWSPIERICAASGIDIRRFREQPEDNIAGVLSMWYAQHRAAGGAPDATMDDLIAETDIEDTHGHGQSYKPGRA